MYLLFFSTIAIATKAFIIRYKAELNTELDIQIAKLTIETNETEDKSVKLVILEYLVKLIIEKIHEIDSLNDQLYDLDQKFKEQQSVFVGPCEYTTRIHNYWENDRKFCSEVKKRKIEVDVLKEKIQEVVKRYSTNESQLI